MKKLKIILLVIVGLFVVGLIGLFIYIKNFDADKFRPEIIARISESLGRDVQIEHIDMALSFKNGLNLEIDRFSIEEDSDGEEYNLLSVKTVLLNLDIFELIKNKKLVIKNIEVFDPIVRFVQLPAEESNYSQLVKKEQPVLSKEKKIEASSRTMDVSPDFNIKALRVHNAMVDIKVQKEDAVEQVIALDDLDFNMQNFMLAQPVPFNAGVSIFSEKQNLQMQGTLFVNPVSQRFELNNVRVDTDLADIDVAKLVQSFAELDVLKADEGLKGNIAMTIYQLVVSANSAPQINIEGHLEGGAVHLQELSTPITDIRATIISDEQMIISIENIHAQLFSGQIDGDIKIERYLSQMRLDGKLKADGMNLSAILSDYDLPVEVEGVVGLDSSFWMSTNSIFDLFNLQGDFRLNVMQGRILDFNVLDTMLSQISVIPNLVEKVYQNLSPKYKEKLTAKDTDIKVFNTKCTLKSVLLQCYVDVEADEFIADISTSLDKDMRLTNQTYAMIPAELSYSLVQSVEELSALLNNNKQIMIPFKTYAGPVDKFSLQPDIKEVGQKVIQQKGKEELRKVIFKALDIEEPPQQEINPEQPVQQPPAKSNKQQLIEGLLNEIPLFK